ncbi:MAG: hypothetical protein FJ149_08555 [Euryarchaeota archaeon]|nr:hypothetical protein [Euryarchaeota archaeon]
MTPRSGIVIDGIAREMLEGYLDEVRKCLDEVDAKERMAILEEIDGALREKTEIVAGEQGMKEVTTDVLGKVLEGFGSPAELAAGYAGVAKAGPGRNLKLLSAFEAFWAAVIFVPGAFLFGNAVMFWWPYDNLTSYGQLLLGAFFLAGCFSLIGLLALQLWAPALRRGIGRFALVVTAVVGLAALNSIGINRDSLSVGLPVMAAGALLWSMAAILIGGCIWGFWSVFPPAHRGKETASWHTEAAPRRFPARGKATVALVSILLVLLYSLAAGLLTAGWAQLHGGPTEGDERYRNSEPVGGPFNASIERWQHYDGMIWYDFYKIVYYMDGQMIEGAYDLSLWPALEWIKSNTTVNATVLSWWDYGHMIRGYTGRSGVIYYPSRSLLNTVADRSSVRHFEPEEKVRQVAGTLLSDNDSEVKGYATGFGARYILVTRSDADGKAWAILQGAGLDQSTYIKDSGGGHMVPTEKGKELWLFRIWDGKGIEGMNVVFEDVNNVIVEVP